MSKLGTKETEIDQTESAIDIHHAKIYHQTILNAQNPQLAAKSRPVQQERQISVKVTFPEGKDVEFQLNPAATLKDLKGEVDSLLQDPHVEYILEIAYPRETVLNPKSDLNKKIAHFKLGTRIAFQIKAVNPENGKIALKAGIKTMEKRPLGDIEPEKTPIKTKLQGEVKSKVKSIPKWLKLSKK